MNNGNGVGLSEIGGDRKVRQHNPVPSPPIAATPTQEVEPLTATQERRARRLRMRLDIVREGDGDPRHGKLSTYTNHCCRCDRCKLAKSSYERDLRQRRREQRVGT